MLDVSLKPRKEIRAVGGCRLLYRLSAEGASEVYLAEQIRLGNRRVAVTFLTPEGCADAFNTTSETEWRLQNEAEMLGRFTHLHILPIHDSGYDRGRFYLVTHYAVAGSLADVLCGRHLNLPLAASTVADLVSQVASALHYIHGYSVVHNDVQPANILIDIEPCGQWHAMLANFDHATYTDIQSAHGSDTDVSAYTAPEQYEGRGGPASDQYALAVIAFQLLNGHVPLGERPGIASLPPSLRNLNPSVSEAVETVILCALAQEPADRYPSVAAFATALQAAADEYEQEDATILHPTLVEHANVEADILALHRALNSNHRPFTFAAAGPITSDPAAWDTRPARHISPPTPRARSGHATSLRQEVRLLVVGLVSLLLMLLVVAASPGLWPVASSQGGNLAKSLAGWANQTGAQPLSHGHVLAPPPFQTTPGRGTGQQLDARGRNGAAPLPDALAVAVQPGQRIEARFSFANTGDTSWSHARGYALSCASRRHTHATCLGFAPIGFGGYNVPPGGRFIFTLRLTAPARAGIYAIWLNVGHNGQLFGTQDMLLIVRT